MPANKRRIFSPREGQRRIFELPSPISDALAPTRQYQALFRARDHRTLRRAVHLLSWRSRLISVRKPANIEQPRGLPRDTRLLRAGSRLDGSSAARPRSLHSNRIGRHQQSRLASEDLPRLLNHTPPLPACSSEKLPTGHDARWIAANFAKLPSALSVRRVTQVIVPKPSEMYQIKGSGPSEVAMKGVAADLDKIDEALVTYDLPDEALEAAARVDGRPAITAGYCATASNAWYCLPY